MKYLSLDKRRRFAYGFLALMVLASIAELVWTHALGRPIVYVVLTWLPVYAVFPLISVIAVARETAALKAGRPPREPSPRAVRLLLGIAIGLLALTLAIGLLLVQRSPTT